MSDAEVEVRCSQMNIYQDISFDDDSEEVVGFRESHCRFKA